MTLRVPTMTSRPGHGRFDHNNKDLALSTVPGLVVLLVTIGARMPGRAVSTGLPRRNQRAGDAAAVAHERQGQGRRNPRPAAGTIPHQQLDEPVRGPERAADHRLRRMGQATLTTSWAFPVAPAATCTCWPRAVVTRVYATGAPFSVTAVTCLPVGSTAPIVRATVRCRVAATSTDPVPSWMALPAMLDCPSGICGTTVTVPRPRSGATPSSKCTTGQRIP